MVSTETKSTACLSQPASVSPGDSHVTCMAGQSRVPHMAAVGGNWPRSWGWSCPCSGSQESMLQHSSCTRPLLTHRMGGMG